MSPNLKDRFRRVRHSAVAANAAVLYVLQGAGYVLPLLVLPYLARVLRPDGWGLLVFAQSLAAWLTLVVEYGFNLSATRDIARQRGESNGTGTIVAGVQGAKSALSVLVVVIAAIVGMLVPTFRAHPDYGAWAAVIAVVYGFSPIWYFQGTERLRGPVLLDVLGRVASAAGVFLWVREPADGWIVLALQGMAGAVSTVGATVWMYREVPLRRPSWRGALNTLREARGLFLFRGASGVYTLANSFILGLLSTTQAVAFFGGAEKLMRAVISLLDPISQALYPRMSHLAANDRERAARVVRGSLVLLSGLGLFLAGAVAVAAPLLVRVLLGPGYEPVVPVLRVLAVMLPVVAVGTVLGIQWALPLGRDRMFYRLVIGAGVLNLAAAAWLAPRYGAMGMAVSVVLAQVFVSAGLVWDSWRADHGLWSGATRRNQESAATQESPTALATSEPG